jgi:hypothetical protein
MKLILIPFLLVAISACAAMKSNESIHLMDGSYLFVEEGKAERIVDSTGEIVGVKKGTIMELANGNFIYIKQDGSVNKIKTDSYSRKLDENNNGHSH